MLARYGGDEFAVVLPGGDAESSHPTAEAIRAGVERAAFLERNRARTCRRFA